MGLSAHNLNLHSELVISCRWPAGDTGRRLALRFSSLDNVAALSFALLVNAAILGWRSAVSVATAATGQRSGQACHLLTPMLRMRLATLLFGVVLLAAGQSSTLCATLAGQVVREGFLRLRLPDWQCRLLTRSLALIPAMGAVLLPGDGATKPAACAQPGGAQPAASLLGASTGLVLRASWADGRAARLSMASCAGVGMGRGDRRDQRLPAAGGDAASARHLSAPGRDCGGLLRASPQDAAVRSAQPPDVWSRHPDGPAEQGRSSLGGRMCRRWPTRRVGACGYGKG